MQLQRRGSNGARAAAAYLARASGTPTDRERRWQLNAAQYAFVECGERFSFYVGGRGAGKTFSGAIRALVASQTMMGSLGLIGAPTYPMLRDFAQRTFMAQCPAGLIRRHHRSENRTEMVNGSEILWRSADDPDRYRGLNLAWFWLDEGPYCGYEAWRILKGALRQEGYETRAWATGTGVGVDGYARDFEMEPKAGHALFRASTRANLAHLPAGFIEDLGYTGELALQEIEGQFVAFSGLVYRLDRGVHVVHREAESPGFWRRVVGGVDWGYTNPTAAVVFGLDGDSRAHQLAEWYERRASFHDSVLPALLELTRTHGVACWHCDSEDPGHIADFKAAVERAGLSCQVRAAVKGAGSVSDGIQTVTRLLAVRGDGRPGLTIEPGCVNTLAEYGMYRYATMTEGQSVRRDAREEPIKLSDHALDATRYALHGELAGVGRTDAYLSQLGRWMGLKADSAV